MSLKRRFGDLWGQSQPMLEVFALLDRVARSDLAVLLSGETGTGKELGARALHSEGTRPEGPFVVVDCGAIQPNLIESEFFGHERAAFTGADKQRKGAFEVADGGTVLLDEIGELPLTLQPKLLRVLERREVQRLGGNRPIQVDVRVVSATHRDLAAMVNEGTFREDLYFRLAEVEVRLPPLRDRAEDIPLLATRLLRELADSGGPNVSLADEAIRVLEKRAWRGNVRELRNALRRAAVLADGAELTAEALDGPSTDAPARESPMARVDARLDLKGAREKWSQPLERQYLIAVLEIVAGDLAAASAHAAVHRKSFERLLRRHGIKAADYR